MRRVSLGVGVLLLVAAWSQAEQGLDHIAALVRNGQPLDALGEIQRLSEKDSERDSVRYLRGRLLLETGRPCDAMTWLAATPPTLPPVLQSDSARKWAHAAARCGRCDEARPALLESKASDARARRLDLAIAADCAVTLGELDEAAQELEELTEARGAGVDRVALLRQLVEVYERLGRQEGAQDAARRAWVLQVRADDDHLLSSLERLARPTVSDRIDRAERLVAARRFRRAVEELEAIEVGKGKPELNKRWHHVYGMALFRTRKRYEEAARVLKKSAALGGRYAAIDEFHGARALARADQDRKAVADFRRFASRHPRHPRAQEARYLAAWLEIRIGRKRGELAMERLLQGKRRLRGKWRRAALWQLGFRAVETKRYARAVRFLERYERAAGSSMERAQALYWLGRAHQRIPQAVEAYRKAIAVEPLHWYAVLAAARLRRLRVSVPGPFDGVERRASSPNRASLELPPTYLAYRELGLESEGIDWLRRQETALVRNYPQRQRRPLLASMYLDAGAYNEALRVARQRVDKLHHEPSHARWWWEAAYPRPWRDIVDGHRGDLPAALVYATMRQESGFAHDALSRAGAVGLMQVLPSSGTRLAGEPITRTMLFSPDTNIALGVEEMTTLAAAFDGVYPLSIAAYNAGRRRVQRWLIESRRMELDRFVERIPFNETRNYVRRVMTHYARYRYLDDPKAGWLRLPRFVRP